MLAELFGFYLKGLALSVLTVLSLAVLWMGYRALKKYDKTIEERRQVLYEAILICFITLPILAFAYMAILIMINA